LRAILILRGKLFLRRHGTPFDALVLGATIVLAWLSGRTLARAVPAVSTDAAGAVALALLGFIATALSTGAHRLLFRARELPFLLPQPVSEHSLVAARLVELTAANTIALACVVALVGGASDRLDLPGSALAVILPAPLLAGAELLAARVARWLLDRRPRAARALGVAGVASVVLALGAGLVFPVESRALVGRAAPSFATPVSPGHALVALVRSNDVLSAVALLIEGAVLAGLALAWVPRGLAAAIDAAAARPTGARRLPFRLAGILAAPLPAPSGALVRRDLALLVRGAFPRGVLVLVLLPLGLLVFREASLDRELAQEGLLELAALFVEGTLATVAAFLFAIDFPAERASKLVLERAQPVSGSHVLWARAFEAALPSLVFATALGTIAWSAEIGLSCALLGIACAHHGAAFGLRTEGRGADLAEAAGFPISAGFLVVAGAFALAISDALFSLPLGALAYPLVYRGLGARAAREWEHAEVERSLGL
jgi:hypothetical protein